MNSKRNWVLKVDPKVYKVLSKIPKEYSRKIFNTIKSLSLDPFAGDIQKIKDQDKMSIRDILSSREGPRDYEQIPISRDKIEALFDLLGIFPRAEKAAVSQEDERDERLVSGAYLASETGIYKS